jgi:transcription elongation factor GreA
MSICYHSLMQIPRRRSDALRKPDDQPIHMTPAGIEALRKRYDHLKKVLPELAAEAARTAAYGDRSDNAEYKQAKGALRYTHYEIYRLEDQLKRVVAIVPSRNDAGTIQLGSTVVVEQISPSDGSASKQKTYEILGPQETDPGKGRISNQSPLGAALMGKVAGDILVIPTSGGPQEYRIITVR